MATIAEEEKKKRAATGGVNPNANQTAMYVAGAQAAAQSRPPEAPVAAGTDNTLGNFTPPPGQRYVAPSAPVPAAAPVAREVSPSAPVDPQALADRQTASGVWDAIKGLNRQAGAAIADVATLPIRGIVGAYDSAVVRPMRAAGMNAAYLSPNLVPNGADVNSMTPFYDQLRASGAADSPSAAMPTPAAPATAIPGGAPGARTDVQRGGAAVPANAAPVAPAGPIAALNQAADPNAIRRIDAPGQSPMFTNMPNDGALMARGPISAQNQAAAQNLSDRYATAYAPAAPVAEQTGYQPATIRHSGNDWRSANDLRNLEVSASSITAGPGSKADRAYQKALETDQALKGGNDPYTTSLNRDAAATDRANTLERGALTRTAMQEAGTNMRAGMIQRLAQQKDAREESKFGMDKASAERIQSAQIALVNAKTPEEASKARQLLNTLTGRESKTPGWKGIALQGGTDAMGNKTQSVLAAINEATGEVRRYDEGAQYNPASNGVAKPTSAAEYNALPSGTPYIKDGVTRIKP